MKSVTDMATLHSRAVVGTISALRSPSSSSSSNRLLSKTLSTLQKSKSQHHFNSTQQQQTRWGHTVRLIALEDLPHGKGYEGDVVHVKAGYARNYLIPQGFAVLATPSAKKVLAETLKQRAFKEANIVKQANETAEALKTLEVKIAAKTGEGDKLFGSVGNANVSEALKEAGHEIDRKFITIAGNNVKRLGKYDAKVRLHRDVIVDLPFEVIAEK